MNKEQIEIALRVFGAEFDTPFEDIKKEYKNLAQVFHPDRYEAGSARQEWASEKLIAIINSYEILKEFYATYPDGPPQAWHESKQASNASHDQKEASNGADEYCDWQQWQEGQNRTNNDSSTREAQWHAEQELKQADLFAQHKKMNRDKFFFYGKIAAVVFISCIWLGRIGAMEATKVMAANEQQGVIEQQAYEQARQGTNIDGFEWSQSDLDARHRNQFDELRQKNEKRSVDMWTSGLFTTALTLLVLWMFLASGVHGIFKGGKNETKSVDEK